MASPPPFPLEEYQNDPKYPPDKATSGWSATNDDDDVNGWKLSHDALRHELECLTTGMAAVVGARPVETWHVRALQSIWTYHHEHWQKHQAAEDTFYFPFLQRRIKFPDTVSAQHGAMETAVQLVDEKFTALMKRVKEQPTTTSSSPAAIVLDSDLVASVEQLDRDARAHLELEESFVLPCTRAYFTEHELAEVQKRMGMEGGHSGSLVYVIGEETFRRHTMPRLHIPFFVWNLAFARDLRQYRERVVQPVAALQANQEPATVKTSWFGRGG